MKESLQAVGFGCPLAATCSLPEQKNNLATFMSDAKALHLQSPTYGQCSLQSAISATLRRLRTNTPRPHHIPLSPSCPLGHVLRCRHARASEFSARGNAHPPLELLRIAPTREAGAAADATFRALLIAFAPPALAGLTAGSRAWHARCHGVSSRVGGGEGGEVRRRSGHPVSPNQMGRASAGAKKRTFFSQTTPC